MKFLMTSTFYPPLHIGGDAMYVKYLAEALVKSGHEVHILHSADAYYIKRGYKEMKREDDGIHVHTIRTPMGKMRTAWGYAFGRNNYAQSKFRELVKRLEPEVVHHNNISLLDPRYLEKMEKYVNLYTAHDYWLICPKNDLLKRGNVLCNGGSCFACLAANRRVPQFWSRKINVGELDALITPSNYMKETLSAKLDAKYKLLYNFVPDAPKQIKDSGEENFFLYLGLIAEHKGIIPMLEGFKNNDKKLIIIGKGPLESHVKKYIEGKGLEKRVKCLGWVRDIYPYMKDANGLVMPSMWPENSPLTALEALSVGTPVYGTNMGGLQEIVRMVSPKLILQIEQLVKDLEGIEKIDISRDGIKELFHNEFSERRYVKDYLNLISSIEK